MWQVVLLTLLSGALAAQPHQALLDSTQVLELSQVKPYEAFTIWAEQHSREYVSLPHSQEHKERYDIWRANAEMIYKHQQSGSSMQLALNEFADMSWEEFSSQRLGFRGDLHAQKRAERLAGRNISSEFLYANADELPESLDWREKGAVSEVKNQGQCGSCWSFATTGAIEGVNAIRTGSLVSLSEQQLVDCDTEKDMGCGGGLMDYAYEYIIKNGGLDTEDDYKYWSSFGFSFWRCNRRKEADRTVVTIDSYQDVPEDEDALLKAAAHQPISVGICASSTMMFYSGGIIDKCCDGLNHGVLVVGYGEEKGIPYWIVKNSWGGAWGEKGFFRLRRNAQKGGLCGIATAASFPVKTSPNHPVPAMCDVFGWTECPVGSSCSCSFSLFGFMCLWHDCCPLEGGVTCSDLKHCCPASEPVCDLQQESCVSEDGTRSVPWAAKSKAAVAQQPRALPAHGAAAAAAGVERTKIKASQQQAHRITPA